MSKYDSWKKTEDIEIDLADLLRILCMQWKRITICALASAMVLGTAGWLKGMQSQQEVVTESEPYEMTEAEEQAVTDAVRLEEEIRDLETYMEYSVLMQIDPYHKIRYVMLYCIDHTKGQRLPVITESYLNFVKNGGAAEALMKSESRRKLDKSYLAEIISVYQNTGSFSYQSAADRQSECFYVEIIGKNHHEAEKMALDMQDVLKEYSGVIKQTAGSHRLTLVSSTENVMSDVGLQSQQNDKRALLSSNRTNLRALTDAFNSEQMLIYQENAGMKGDVQKESGSVSDGNEANEIASENIAGFNMKYILFGFMAGIFVYCGIIFCWYFFCDTVKSTREMKKMYTFPVYGGISLKDTSRKHGRILLEEQQDNYGCTEGQVMNRIKLFCQKQGIVRLCALADFPLNVLEKECLGNISGQLKGWGIDMTVAENAAADTDVWDSLADMGNVLMVCRTGTTTHRMIDDAMNFYLENGIEVAGAVAFLQNR